MDHHHFMHKITSLFPSSCQLRTIPDVSETSNIPISKPPFLQKTQIQNPKVSKNNSQLPESKIKKSPSSNNSGFFSTASEKDLADDSFDRKTGKFFSFSSGSSETFHLKTDQSFSRRFDEKIIFDLARCPSALSSKSTNTLLIPPEKPMKKAFKPSKNVSKNIEIQKGFYFVEPLTELYYNGVPKDRQKVARTHQKSRRKRNPAVAENDYVEESIAVEKSSSDPQGDFRKSMVEMIVEKRIFGAKDLERLLDCFLCLNSPRYHRIILEVFVEICDTLFSN